MRVFTKGRAIASGAAQSSAEHRLLTLTNQVRASAGVPPLALDGTLSAVAATWSTAQAVAGTISHNPALKSQISGFARVGENVGMGGSVEAVHRALVASPGHYANIVNPDYSRVGLGVVQSGITVYLAQVFVQPSADGSAGSAGPAAAAPTATTAVTAPTPGPKAPTTTVTTVRTAGLPGSAPASPAAAGAAASSAPAQAPSAWHLSTMTQLAAWDRLVS